MKPPCPVAHQWPCYFKVSSHKVILYRFSLCAKSVHCTPEAVSVISKTTYLMEKGNIWSSYVPWMVFEILSHFPRPYPCSSSLGWAKTQIPHPMETRPCFFSLSQPCHFSSQLCPEYILAHLVIDLNRRHFIERKQKRNRKIENRAWKEPPPQVQCDAEHSRGQTAGRGFALPCCSRHICRGAPRSEPSCVCSG